MSKLGFSRPRLITEHDLLQLYKLYGRKRGKTLGMAKAMRQIKTIEQYEQLRRAIENYNRLIEAEGTEPQYVMYFSTFMSQWRDYLEDEVMDAVVLDVSDIFQAKES